MNDREGKEVQSLNQKNHIVTQLMFLLLKLDFWDNTFLKFQDIKQVQIREKGSCPGRTNDQQKIYREFVQDRY